MFTGPEGEHFGRCMPIQQPKKLADTKACQATAAPTQTWEGQLSLNLPQSPVQKNRAAATAAGGSSDPNTKICTDWEPTDYGQEVADVWSRSQAGRGL